MRNLDQRERRSVGKYITQLNCADFLRRSCVPLEFTPRASNGGFKTGPDVIWLAISYRRDRGLTDKSAEWARGIQNCFAAHPSFRDCLSNLHQLRSRKEPFGISRLTTSEEFLM